MTIGLWLWALVLALMPLAERAAAVPEPSALGPIVPSAVSPAVELVTVLDEDGQIAGTWVVGFWGVWLEPNEELLVVAMTHDGPALAALAPDTGAMRMLSVVRDWTHLELSDDRTTLRVHSYDHVLDEVTISPDAMRWREGCFSRPPPGGMTIDEHGLRLGEALILSQRGLVMAACPSPSGAWLAVTENQLVGTYQRYRISVDGRVVEPVGEPADATSQPPPWPWPEPPAESPDGRWQAVRSDDGVLLSSIDGEQRRLPTRRLPYWSADSRYVAYKDQRGAITIAPLDELATPRILVHASSTRLLGWEDGYVVWMSVSIS